MKWNGITPTGYPAGHVITPMLAGSNGTLIVVSSTSYALTATFHYSRAYLGTFPTGLWVTTPIPVSTGTDLGAIQTDGGIFARSAKVPTIQLPSTIAPHDEPEFILAALNDQLHFVTVGQQSLWHGLFGSTVGQVTQGVFTLSSTPGVTYTIWNNDTIMVQFSNGWTVQIAWTPGTPQGWAINWKSLKNKDGIPINLDGTPQNSNTTGATGGPGLNLGTATLPAGSSITIWPTLDITPQGTVTIIELNSTGGSTSLTQPV